MCANNAALGRSEAIRNNALIKLVRQSDVIDHEMDIPYSDINLYINAREKIF